MRVYLAKGCTSYEAPTGAAARWGGGEHEVNVVVDPEGRALGVYWAQSQGPSAWCRAVHRGMRDEHGESGPVDAWLDALGIHMAREGSVPFEARRAPGAPPAPPHMWSPTGLGATGHSGPEGQDRRNDVPRWAMQSISRLLDREPLGRSVVDVVFGVHG